MIRLRAHAFNSTQLLLQMYTASYSESEAVINLVIFTFAAEEVVLSIVQPYFLRDEPQIEQLSYESPPTVVSDADEVDVEQCIRFNTGLNARLLK